MNFWMIFPAVILFVLFFMRVPVAYSMIISGAVYFLFNPGLHGHRHDVPKAGVRKFVVHLPGDPLFLLRGGRLQLRGHHPEADGPGGAAGRPSPGRAGSRQYRLVHYDGRTVRLRRGGHRHGVENAGAGDGAPGIRQGLFLRHHGGLLLHHADHPPRAYA